MGYNNGLHPSLAVPDPARYAVGGADERVGGGRARSLMPPRISLLAAIEEELLRATSKFGPFHSAHEGFAVLKEEVDELWQEVKHGTPERAREEAIQVAAMALRFLMDVK